MVTTEKRKYKVSFDYPAAAGEPGLSLSAMYILKNHAKLENKVIGVSEEIDLLIARRKLDAWDIAMDKLTPVQQKYLNSWNLYGRLSCDL
ncbi:hypothetical protein [Bacilliculturomica massiliensis]|uniref:hypothetical protein n=1 Tax=Bacilliculturomica massiliensis TaxID=1917867 RepID=UPI001031243A|nr:hypothetical protein [Bacilliculturomica massiliensis]